MKKKILSVILTAAAALSLTACAQQDGITAVAGESVNYAPFPTEQPFGSRTESNYSSQTVFSSGGGAVASVPAPAFSSASASGAPASSSVPASTSSSAATSTPKPAVEVDFNYVPKDTAPNPDEDFTWMDDNSFGGYMVAGYKGTREDVVVPATHNGAPVRRVFGGAFSNKKNIKSVTLPEGIKRIDGGAFTACHSLQLINFPSTVKDLTYASVDRNSWFEAYLERDGMIIVNNIFLCAAGPDSSGEFTVPEGVTTIAEWAFKKTEGYERIYLPSTLTTICEETFWGCKNLKTITVPEGVRTIEPHTFSDCDDLESIYLPATVTTVYDNAFDWCGKLTEVHVAGQIEVAHDYYGVSNGLFEGSPNAKFVYD